MEMNVEEILAKLKILLVEDDTIASFLAEYELNKAGIGHIDKVENGHLAIKYIEEKRPQIIFLDLNMPIINGFEFLNLISDKHISHIIKVVILTSSIRPADQSKASEFKNVIGYVEKPLNSEKIREIMKSYVSMHI